MNYLTALLLGAHHMPLHKGPQHPSYATATADWQFWHDMKYCNSSEIGLIYATYSTYSPLWPTPYAKFPKTFRYNRYNVFSLTPACAFKRRLWFQHPPNWLLFRLCYMIKKPVCVLNILYLHPMLFPSISCHHREHIRERSIGRLH